MKFDIAIIGGGPGGLHRRGESRKAGRSVVLFEKRTWGAPA